MRVDIPCISRGRRFAARRRATRRGAGGVYRRRDYVRRFYHWLVAGWLGGAVDAHGLDAFLSGRAACAGVEHVSRGGNRRRALHSGLGLLSQTDVGGGDGSISFSIRRSDMKLQMKSLRLLSVAAVLIGAGSAKGEMQISLESAPPVVVKTFPVAGATGVDPALTEIRVTYSKAMQDGSWSWSTWGQENLPEIAGEIHYLADGRICVLPVKLQPGKFYASWLNSDQYKNFKDAGGRPAVPYLLTFRTAEPGSVVSGGGVSEDIMLLLNNDQRAVA